MNFDLMSAVSAGSGFMQGQDQAQQMAFQREQQTQQSQAAKMALLMNGLKLQQEQKQAGFVNTESEYARQLATDPDTMNLPPDQMMDLMARNAARSGDVLHANELFTNSANYRSAQAMDEQRKATAEARMAANRQKLLDRVSGELAAAGDPALGGSKEKFDQTKMAIMSEEVGTPQDMDKFRQVQWDPDVSRRLRAMGMTARQQAETAEAEARLAQTRKHDAIVESHEATKNTLAQEKLSLDKAREERLAKVGRPVKTPSTQELVTAGAALKEAGYDNSSITAKKEVLDVAKQLQNGNKNISDSQAMAQAAQWIKRNEVKDVKDPTSWTGGKVQEHKMVGVTPQDPITYSGNPDDLIPGRYYKNSKGQVAQYSGTGFKPVQ